MDVAVPQDQDLEEGAGASFGGLRSGRPSSPGFRRLRDESEEFITPEDMLLGTAGWRLQRRSEGAIPVERRSEGPVPGFEKHSMDADMELQREVEIGMMEHLVEENEKLKEELRDLRERKDRERSRERNAEAARYKGYDRNAEAARYKGYERNAEAAGYKGYERNAEAARRKGYERSTEDEGVKRWPEDVPRPPRGSPERDGKRPRRIQRYTPQGTRVPDSPEQAEVTIPELPGDKHVPREVEEWLQQQMQERDEQRAFSEVRAWWLEKEVKELQSRLDGLQARTTGSSYWGCRCNGSRKLQYLHLHHHRWRRRQRRERRACEAYQSRSLSCRIQGALWQRWRQEIGWRNCGRWWVMSPRKQQLGGMGSWRRPRWCTTGG